MSKQIKIGQMGEEVTIPLSEYEYLLECKKTYEQIIENKINEDKSKCKEAPQDERR